MKDNWPSSDSVDEVYRQIGIEAHTSSKERDVLMPGIIMCLRRGDSVQEATEWAKEALPRIAAL